MSSIWEINAACCGYTILGDCIPCTNGNTNTGSNDVLVKVDGQLVEVGWHLPKVNIEELKVADALVISLAGSAGTLKDNPIAKLLSDVKAMDRADYVGTSASLIKSEKGKKIISITGRPEFELVGGVTSFENFSDALFVPSPQLLETEINDLAKYMKKGSKIILIGKSMGGCKLYKAANRLSGKVNIDLLILVDASCEIKDHSGVELTLNDNIKNAYSFYQRESGQKQNGYEIETKDGFYRSNTNVNSCGICDNVDHSTIDTCEKLINKIVSITKKQIWGADISNIIQCLLLD
jgi:hypothetical protein